MQNVSGISEVYGGSPVQMNTSPGFRPELGAVFAEKEVRATGSLEYVQYLESQLSQALAAGARLQHQLQATEVGAHRLWQQVAQLQQESKKREAVCRELQGAQNAWMGRSRLLEQQLYALQVSTDQTTTRLQQELAGIRAELASSKTQQATDDSKMESLSQEKAQLQAECQSLREQLREIPQEQLRKIQEERLRKIQEEKLSKTQEKKQRKIEEKGYAKNPKVNELIAQLTTKKMVRMPTLRRLLLSPTAGQQNLWEDLWKNRKCVTDQEIKDVRSNELLSQEDQVILLFNKAAASSGDINLVELLNSKDMPRALKCRLYAGMNANLAALQRAYPSAE